MLTARVNGVTLYYEEIGSGFPLVWCHEFICGCGSSQPVLRSRSRCRDASPKSVGALHPGVIVAAGSSFYPDQTEPFSGRSDSCIWSLQRWEMTTPLKHDQARPGNTGTHLTAVLHRREAILLPPHEKCRAHDARQISPSVRPGEQRRVLPQEHRRARTPRHPTEATRRGDGVGSALVGNRCREVLHYGVELPPLHAVVAQARRSRIAVRTRTASHQPQSRDARGRSSDYLQCKTPSIGGSREQKARRSLPQDSVRRFRHAWLSDRQGDRLGEIPQPFDLWAIQLIVA